MRVCPGLILWAAASALAEQAGAPVFFIAHPSTTNQTVRFVGATGDLRVGFEDSGLVFQRDGAVLRMQFRGENPNARVEGAEPLAGRVNFLNGSDSARWRTGLPTYGELVYRGVYPGIDARYSAHGSRMKAEFVVQPSADPGQIQLEYSGGMVALRPDQGLRVSGEAGELNELAPVAFQQTEKGRVNVEVRFVLLDRHTVGFALGAYDLSRALTPIPQFAQFRFEESYLTLRRVSLRG